MLDGIVSKDARRCLGTVRRHRSAHTSYLSDLLKNRCSIVTSALPRPTILQHPAALSTPRPEEHRNSLRFSLRRSISEPTILTEISTMSIPNRQPRHLLPVAPSPPPASLASLPHPPCATPQPAAPQRAAHSTANTHTVKQRKQNRLLPEAQRDRLGDPHPGGTAFSNLIDVLAAHSADRTSILDPLAIDAHPTLTDRPDRLGGAFRQPRLFQ